MDGRNIGDSKESSIQRGPVDPKKRYPNPSFGLWLWGPLVPANDCKPCLYGLTGIQLSTGLLLWWLPGRRVPPGRRVWVTRSLRTMGILSGSYLMLLACLEIVRLQLPTDPWQQDAARARQDAKRKGEKPSYWFGPVGYRPIEYKEWKKRMDQGISKAKAIGSSVNIAREIYSEIRDNNRELSHKILEDLRRENEENPQTRENKALIELKEEEVDNGKANENSANKSGDGLKSGSASNFALLTSEYILSLLKSKPSSPTEWDALDQWEKLRLETDIAVRIVPHSRGIREEHSVSINLGNEDNASTITEDISSSV